MRKLFAMIFTALALTTAAAHAAEPHRLAIHVDQNDAKVMNLALNNVKNVASYYKEKGEEIIIEVVAYGPGLNMYVQDKSPVKDRISAMSLEMDNIVFSACENTLHAFEKAAGGKVPLISEAKMVPSGVVRLIELQEEGYSYVKP